MDFQEEIKRLKESLQQAEKVQAELDLRVFNLKTLNDVSKDIYGSVDSETIIRNFLLMTMGNFGVMQAFVLLFDESLNSTDQFISIGFQDDLNEALEEGAIKCIDQKNQKVSHHKLSASDPCAFLPSEVELSLPFSVTLDCPGLLGLGPKLVGEPYNDNDIELLNTLINNLIIALKNARSFDEIRRLNKNLQLKNVELEKAFKELTAAMRKVEILEDIKSNLSKFVPDTVSRLIEKSPNGEIPESKEQDVSVLFLDVEGYTRICERLGDEEMHDIIERHFSAFMDAIYSNNGDVNETVGDGLMVLFLDEDSIQNALSAVRTALKIREDTIKIGQEFSSLYRPLEINMGINSGSAFVGATKFDSYTSSRWTYTARGSITNVAFRLGAHAKGGRIYLSHTTAARIKDQFKLSALGKITLKNVSEEVEIFEI